MDEWRKKRDEYLDDLETFTDLSKKMGENKISLQKKKEDLAKEIANVNSRLQRMNEHIKDLKTTIETQELSPSDAIKLETESKSALEAIERLHKVKAELEAELLEYDTLLQNHAIACESIMEKLNSKISHIRATADFADNFSEQKFTLNLDELLDPDPSKAFGIDCQGSLEPCISRAANSLESRIATVKKDAHDALDRLDETLSARDEAQSIKQILLEKISLLEESLRNDEAAHKSRMEVREREVDAVARKVEARRDPMELEEQMAIMERELAELEALRAKHEADNVQKSKAVVAEIKAALELMAETEQSVQNLVNQVEAHRIEKSANGVQLVSPLNGSETD